MLELPRRLTACLLMGDETEDDPLPLKRGSGDCNKYVCEVKEPNLLDSFKPDGSAIEEASRFVNLSIAASSVSSWLRELSSALILSNSISNSATLFSK